MIVQVEICVGYKWVDKYPPVGYLMAQIYYQQGECVELTVLST